jgi:hypothetical protein
VMGQKCQGCNGFSKIAHDRVTLAR